MQPTTSRLFPTITASILILSTLMMLSSSNWLFLWCALEINLMSFIPLMFSSNKFQENEAATKYFLIQALGSSLILMSTTTMWIPMIEMKSSYIIITALLLKLGMAPCHFWFPSVMTSLSWMNCLILATWQKLGPLMIIAFVMQSQCTSKIMMIVAALNALIGGIMGMNQSKIKSIMAYSSITHMGWMSSLLSIKNPMATMSYYLMYIILLIPLFSTLHLMSTNTMPQLHKACNSYSHMSIIIPIMIMSISGIPPLSGFFPKLMTINLLMPLYPALILTLIIGAMMNMFFYMNMTLSIISAPNSHLKPMKSVTLPMTLIPMSSLLLIIPMSLMTMYAMTLLD